MSNDVANESPQNVELEPSSMEAFFTPEYSNMGMVSSPEIQQPFTYAYSPVSTQLPDNHPMVAAQLYRNNAFPTPDSYNYAQSFYRPMNAEEAGNAEGGNSFNPNMFDENGELRYQTGEAGENFPAFPVDDMGLSNLVRNHQSQDGFVASEQIQSLRMYNTIDPNLAGTARLEDHTYLQPLADNNYVSSNFQVQGEDYSQQPNMYGKRSRQQSPQTDPGDDDYSECGSNGSDPDYFPDDDDNYVDAVRPTKNTRSRKKVKTASRPNLLGPAKARRLKAQEVLKEQTVVELKVPPGPPILNWVPSPYTGPQAVPIGTTTVTNAYQEFITYQIYNPLPVHGTHNDFYRTPERGHLDPNIHFDAPKMHDFIKTHPLGRNLLFRVEKRCVWSGTRYIDSFESICRAQNCLVSTHKRTIREGQFRIAIDEVVGRIPRGQRWTNDPFFVACYFHVECFEHLTDIGQLARWAMLRSFPRVDIPGEPRTSKTEPNRLCLSEKIDNCFKRFCKRIYDDPSWNAYNTNVVEKLSTQLWLTNVRKGKTSLGVKPTQLPTEQAKKLIQNKGPDPGWGGSRFTGIKVADAEKVVALGAKDKLRGSAHNVKDDNKRAVDEVNALRNVDDFSDGEEWEVSVFGLEKRCDRPNGHVLQYHQSPQQQARMEDMSQWQPGTQNYGDGIYDPGYYVPADGNYAAEGTMDPRVMQMQW